MLVLYRRYSNSRHIGLVRSFSSIPDSSFSGDFSNTLGFSRSETT